MFLRPWLNKGWLSKTGAKVSWQLLSELVSCLLPLWLMANFLPEEPFQRLVIKTTGRQSGLWEGRAVCPLAPKPWACLDRKCVGQSCSCSRYFKDHDMAGWMKSQGLVLSHAPVKKEAKNKYLISLHPACIKSWEALSVLCFKCQVDTHIHMYPYIYIYIYIQVLKIPLCFHGIPSSPMGIMLSPTQPDAWKELSKCYNLGSGGSEEGGFAVKGSDFDSRAGNSTRAVSTPKSPS